VAAQSKTRNLRTKGTNDATGVWCWRPGSSPNSQWCESVHKSWIYNLISMGNGKKEFTHSRRTELVCLWKLLPSAFCSIWVPSVLDCAAHIWSQSSLLEIFLDTPRNMLYQFSRHLSIQSLQPKLFITVAKKSALMKQIHILESHISKLLRQL
jgi:hypothetical protein